MSLDPFIFKPGNVIIGTRNLEGNNLRTLVILNSKAKPQVVSGGYGPYYEITAINELGLLVTERIRVSEQWRWIKLDLSS